MSYPKACLLSTHIKIIISILILLFIVSCKSSDSRYLMPTIVKKYPKNKPFIYKTNIKLTGNLSKTERENLGTKLRVQLEDSVNPKASQKVLWQVIKRPPVYDTFFVNQSTKFMKSLLITSGYFKNQIVPDTQVIKDGDKWKTILNFNVTTGPLWHLDSIWYSIQQAEMQKLADSTKVDSTKKQKMDSVTLGVGQPLQKLVDSTVKESYLKKGSSFSQDTIKMELDRLVELYRNNGYLRFTTNELLGVWDTVDVAFLHPEVDPLEQLNMLNEFLKKRENPTATLEIKLRPGFDSARMIKYYVGKTFIYPDLGPDSTGKKDTVIIDSSYTLIYSDYHFKPRIFPENIYFRTGQVYNQSRYLRTVNRFNSLVAWRLVNIEARPRPDSDTVDFHVKLTPAKKYLFSANIEGSRNDNNLFVEGNLLGIGANVSLQNRNFARSASQTNTVIRYGTELSVGTGEPFISSRQASFGYNIFIPRGFPRFKFFPEKLKEKFKGNTRTVVAFNLANTQRVELYNLTTFNSYIGYEWQFRNKVFAAKAINVEYSFLKRKPRLDTIFLKNPGLANVFNDGLVISHILSYTVNSGTKRNINTVKANGEISGFTTPLFSDFLRKNLYRYLKLDGEYKRLMKTGTSDLVVRGFVGIGLASEIKVKNEEPRSRYLPFFKAFSAGGPNSMRGWGLRKLGPGSFVKEYDSIPDRFGDIQFEANIEYRFRLVRLFGFNFNSVLFTDVGNVWFRRANPAFPGGEFKFDKFLKELAVDVGTGLRVDLGFFLVRLDYAFKVKNPSPEPFNLAYQYKWFPNWRLRTLLEGTLQFGVTYPF